MFTTASAPGLDVLRSGFVDPRSAADSRGYLAACTTGLPMRATREALRADLDRRPDLAAYTEAVESSRTHAARLLGTTVDRVAIGSQTSVMVGMIAASLPEGSEILCADHEFSSLVMPFVHAGRDFTVRSVPLAALADAIGPRTDLVAFSLVQSACGSIADAAAISEAARRHGAVTLCDVTQAAGWMPVPGHLFDAVVCHAYKWLCAPRGVAFLSISADLQRRLRPLHAGWYAGADPWESCYGGGASLAGDARRFDVSPAWQAFVGAEPALRAFAEADMTVVHAYTTGLAADFCDLTGHDLSGAAIVSWRDPEGEDLARLTASGLTASGRNGRARVAFHVFNDRDDVERAARAIRH